MKIAKNVRVFMILVPALMLIYGASVSKEELDPTANADKNIVYVFPIRDDIAKPSFRIMKEAFEEAAAIKADYLLIHMNTYGGLVNIADSMRTRILNSTNSRSLLYR